jgi:nucleotide-binding universal stress UspA family protein
MLENYRQIIIHAGFAPEAISVRATLRYCPSLAECILAEREQTKCGTIVVGRQGLSRSEEFLFGSVAVSPARSSTMHVTARCG